MVKEIIEIKEIYFKNEIEICTKFQKNYKINSLFEDFGDIIGKKYNEFRNVLLSLVDVEVFSLKSLINEAIRTENSIKIKFKKYWNKLLEIYNTMKHDLLDLFEFEILMQNFLINYERFLVLIEIEAAITSTDRGKDSIAIFTIYNNLPNFYYYVYTLKLQNNFYIHVFEDDDSISVLPFIVHDKNSLKILEQLLKIQCNIFYRTLKMRLNNITFKQKLKNFLNSSNYKKFKIRINYEFESYLTVENSIKKIENFLNNIEKILPKIDGMSLNKIDSEIQLSITCENNINELLNTLESFEISFK